MQRFKQVGYAITKLEDRRAKGERGIVETEWISANLICVIFFLFLFLYYYLVNLDMHPIKFNQDIKGG